jgi:1-aminocyclopropane-1-carboxylate deaminase/D-cysteine desulfhydrase-like pyridoxal-dependent ACC family enzyme
LYSPLQLINHPAALKAGINWYVKRDDLYAPSSGDPFQGNKVRKLRGLEPGLTSTEKLITFGGAYSNHLAATAAFGAHYGLVTVGIVRGEPVKNPVLTYCQSQGMYLHFVTRADYRRKNEKEERDRYLSLFGPGLIINEGGSGIHAFAGTSNILPEVTTQLGYLPDCFQLAAGTGGTAAGVIHSLFSLLGERTNNFTSSLHWRDRERPNKIPTDKNSNLTIEVLPVLKGNWMRAEIEKQLKDYASPATNQTNWRVISDYHFGGYAKQPAELLTFIDEFTTVTGIPIEPIYTGKLFYGVLDLIERGVYASGSTLVTYHSGGIIG